MADQCIVCLENLDVESPAAVAALVAAVAPLDHHHPSKASTSPAESSGASAAAQQHPEAVGQVVPAAANSLNTSSASGSTLPKHHENHDHIAQIEVCGHVLHDSCLKMWSEKANSCPICRQNFNLVHVYDKVGGKLLSSRAVEDKKQVAEFDPQSWEVENPEEEEEAIPCPLCGESDREELLLLCDSCDMPYHTYCIGLEGVPDGSFFCFECSEALGVECVAPSGPSVQRPENNRSSSGRYYFPRTQASMRRARRRARSDEWQGAWGRIAGHVWDALSLDLDYQDDDDPAIFEGLRRSQQLREREQREHERWQQRLDIASRMGAREVFARNIPSVLGRLTAAPASRPPPQEPREVQMAWGALEKARDMENRKRKSRSGTAEPSEPQHEPERKLKRPRTRRVPQTNGEPSSSAAILGAGSSSNHSDHPSPAAGPSNSEPPSFLSSLLKEVEMSTPSDEDKIQALYGRIPGANDVLSPGPSPSRASSITPPPHHSTRPGSPHMTLSSHIEPNYPRANYSPTRSSSPKKNSRSSSPSKRTVHDSRSSPENSDTERRGRPNGTSELQQPKPRRAQRTQPIVVPRTENVSPATSPLPLEIKEVISSIVRTALKPHWHSNKMTSEQYANINRDISRKIYDQVRDPSAVGDEVRQSWEKLATNEVARAVATLGA
ncbi:hypothetical protein OQA88_7521 [Cercophora sp. LCS_1]